MNRTYYEGPLEDLVGAEFVDRDYELDLFWDWAMKIPRKLAVGSWALVGRRRTGKTAILVRLFNRLFWEQDQVLPVYYSLARYAGKQGTAEELTTIKFAWEAIRAYVQCYLAFVHRQPDILHLREPTAEELQSVAAGLGDERMLEILERHQKWVETLKKWPYYSSSGLLGTAIDGPRSLAQRWNMPTVVIIDEFQVLTDVYDPLEDVRHNITGNFQWAADTRWAPMLVSGSAVHTLSRHALGGLLLGRFSQRFIEPLEREHAVELVFRLGDLYRIQINEAMANLLWEKTGGYPYYIKQLMLSSWIRGELTDPMQLEEVLERELTERPGRLYQYFEEEFAKYSTQFNEQGIARQVLYWATKRPGQWINPRQVAEQLGTNPRTVDEVAQKLYESDLLDAAWLSGYAGVKDPLLARYIEFRHQRDILELDEETIRKDWEAEFKSLLGERNRFVGEVAEVYIGAVMGEFDGRQVDGTLFHADGPVTLPRFEGVKRRGEIVEHGDMIEVDLIGTYQEGRRAWLVESKYQQDKVGPAEVRDFLDKAEKVRGEEGYEELVLWFFAKRGATDEAVQVLCQAGALYSDLTGFNTLAQIFGFTGLPA